jgi:class 3 adenylate cyclase
VDFARSIEMVFRVHPQIRDAETGTYCIGGPAHSPHVVAQVRLAPHERIVLDLALRDGTYRLGGKQLASAVTFRVHPAAAASTWELTLGRGLAHDVPRSLRTGAQSVVVVNDFDREVTLRLERTAEREDALTAAQAACHSLFRELFPSEVLSPGELISVTSVALLVTEVKDAPELYEKLGDDQAFLLLHEHFRLLAEQIELEAGAVVKIQGDGLLASFADPACAVRAALRLGQALGKSPRTAALKLRLGVHAGPAMVTTFNDKLDYFGAAVRTAMEMMHLAGGHELVLSEQISFDPSVRTMLDSRELPGEMVVLEGRGLAQRFTIPSAPAPPAP